MKKIVFTEPWKVKLKKVEDELILENEKEIIEKNQYSLISAGTELACLSGKESWFVLPDIPGYIAVGEVLKKGKDVENIEVGDQVYTW